MSRPKILFLRGSQGVALKTTSSVSTKRKIFAKNSWNKTALKPKHKRKLDSEYTIAFLTKKKEMELIAMSQHQHLNALVHIAASTMSHYTKNCCTASAIAETPSRCRNSMIYFINFIFSLHKLKIAKLSHPFSHQFDAVLFYNFRKFEILSATNFSHLDENVIPGEDSV